MRSPRRIGEVIFGRAVGNCVAQRLVLSEVFDVDVASMQKSEIRGIDLTFQRLQIIAFALNERHADLVFRKIENFECRQRRRIGMRTHIDP